MTTLFVAFVVLIAALTIGVSARYLNRRSAVAVSAVLISWLLYVGLLSFFGVVRNTAMRPPGPLLIFVPAGALLALFIVRVRSPVALAFPLWLLLGAQSFRVIVELFLHRLWIDGLVPKMLTFSGANLDIYVGASAPLIAWLSTRGRSNLKLVLAWNIVGLVILANIVVRAVLTAPGPFHRLHTEVPNLMIGMFPFTFIPGFFVPLAILLHALALRSVSITTFPSEPPSTRW